MAKRKHVQDEVEELEQAYTNITGYRPKAQPMRRSHSKKHPFGRGTKSWHTRNSV